MKAKIHELEKFRDQRHLFADRVEAGDTLAAMLQTEYGHIDDGMILAIPSGGVPVGIKISDILGLPFDLLIVRKLQIPGNPEAGFGAMTLAGTVLLNENLLAQLRLTPAQIKAEKKRVGLELEKRNKMLRAERPFPDLNAKRVILVDDGLASGFTMLAAIDMTKKANAQETVVAVPTAPQRSVDHIISEVDNIFCPNIRTAPFFAVAEAYRNWYDLSEKELVEFLQRPDLTVQCRATISGKS
ncbi:MAG: phosphoribosyltransferase family protein [Desulfobacterales bacterium]|jgi:predicted phosphoribosyltransferase